MSTDVAYGWPSIPARLRDLPLVFADVDGTVRGDVVPMVKLARPLFPNFAGKVMFHEPLNTHKFVRFLWNLSRLWTLRTLHSEQRRRYKRLFSELHHLAAALLHDMKREDVRQKYHDRLQHMGGLWFDGAVEMLGRLTRSALVILVTGSEQLQTEQCVQLLGDRGVDTSRILVHGSLYGYDPSSDRFTGDVQQLNVTLDGKRDVVLRYSSDHQRRIAAAAIGNSRPDRALFEAVEPAGLRVLVCPRSVLEKRKENTFVLRKLWRSGYHVHWEPEAFVAATTAYAQSAEETPCPVLATDCSFTNLLTSPALHAAYGWLAEK